MAHSLLTEKSEHHHVVVVVLGDAGRSPRMSYHALSLLQNGSDVTLVGYGGSSLLPQLTEYARGGTKSRFTFRPIPRHPAHALFNTFKPLKALFQLASLFAVLFRCTACNKDRSPADVLLLQIPPAIPTMLVCIIVAFVRRMRLVFDWHNFGHSLMGYGADGERGAGEGVLQRVARSYETGLGPMAHGNLCVTNAMGRMLKETYRGTLATTFYDRPRQDVFTGRTDVGVGVALLSRFVEDERREGNTRSDSALVVRCLQLVMDRMQGKEGGGGGGGAPGTGGQGKVVETTSTACRITSKGARKRNNRFKQSHNAAFNPSNREALLMVSSTSWTPDEDFSILLDAMVRYDDRAAAHTELPCILLFVTGKGPLKDYYLQKIDCLELSHVAIRTVWLEPEDYPRLLGCADLGVSLHASSSGVDLPMKVVDMFGAETPVAALGYPCLAEEMVMDGENGVVFSSSAELCERLEALLVDDWEGLRRMQRYVRGQSGQGYEHWEEAWQRVARGIILGD